MLEIWDFIVLLNLLMQLVWNFLRRYPDSTGRMPWHPFIFLVTVQIHFPAHPPLYPSDNDGRWIGQADRFIRVKGAVTWRPSTNKYWELPRKSLLNLLKAAGFLPAASMKPSKIFTAPWKKQRRDRWRLPGSWIRENSGVPLDFGFTRLHGDVYPNCLTR